MVWSAAASRSLIRAASIQVPQERGSRRAGSRHCKLSQTLPPVLPLTHQRGGEDRDSLWRPAPQRLSWPHMSHGPVPYHHCCLGHRAVPPASQNESQSTHLRGREGGSPAENQGAVTTRHVNGTGPARRCPPNPGFAHPQRNCFGFLFLWCPDPSEILNPLTPRRGGVSWVPPAPCMEGTE